MKYKFRNNFWGYFSFYYSVIGKKLILNLLLCVFVGLLDGLGLTMFIPLLQSASNNGNGVESSENSGFLRYITDALENAGLTINITTILILLIALFILKGIMRFIQKNYEVYIRHYFIKKVRHHMVKRLEGLSYEGYLSMDAGKIQNTVIAEVQRLFQTMSQYFTTSQFVVMLLTYIFLAFLANYQFAILVAIGAGISNFFYKKIYVGTKRASVALSKKGHDVNGILIQFIHYFKYLKATSSINKYSRVLKQAIEEREDLDRRMGFLGAISVASREPVIVCIVAIVIYTQLVWMGTSMDSILLSLLFFYRALTFLMSIQSNWQNFIQNVGSMETVSSLMNEMGAHQEQYGSKPFVSLQKSIELKNVSFKYDDKPILSNINLEISRNKTIALVGESGSGKTTLANMLTGLIKPTAPGEILIDGTPLQNIEINSYREKIGYISQEPVIFKDNIFNNITFSATPTAENLERFWKVAELTSLKEFILSQTDKENTQLGDHGILISGGQKQRISIARELFKDANILIFDEATSALDSETEFLIQKNIERLHGNYTMIIIAHRLSTIRNADMIFLLEQGHIAAKGNFDEMLENSSKFKRMISLQKF